MVRLVKLDWNRRSLDNNLLMITISGNRRTGFFTGLDQSRASYLVVSVVQIKHRVPQLALPSIDTFLPSETND